MRAIDIEIIAAFKKGEDIPWWNAETEDQNINPMGKARIRVLEEKQMPMITKGKLIEEEEERIKIVLP